MIIVARHDITPAQLDALRVFEKLEHRKGVIIVSAPPGQGLTTLAYALLARHDAYTSNIKTLERDPQFRVEGVDHKKFEGTPGTEEFGAEITKIVRRDPDVVLCGDIIDPETGEVISFTSDDVLETLVLLAAAALSGYIREQKLRQEIAKLLKLLMLP